MTVVAFLAMQVGMNSICHEILVTLNEFVGALPIAAIGKG